MLDLERWRVWRDRFRDVTVEKRVSEEGRSVSRRVMVMMYGLERVLLTFS